MCNQSWPIVPHLLQTLRKHVLREAEKKPHMISEGKANEGSESIRSWVVFVDGAVESLLASCWVPCSGSVRSLTFCFLSVSSFFCFLCLFVCRVVVAPSSFLKLL